MMGTRQEPAVATRSTRDQSAPADGALAAAHAAAPVNARPLALNATLTLAAAFERILHNCLDQVQANVAGVLARDAECLHQMRVGLRRLRAALNLFKHMAPLPAALQQDLDWLAARLGQARDWDVLIAQTLAQVDGGDWRTGRQALCDSAEVHAATAHKALLRALRSRRYQHFIPALSDWIVGPAWRPPPDGVPAEQLGHPVRDSIKPLLDQARKRLRRRLRHADPDDAPALHRIRIAAKKLRYAAEFFQALLPPRPLRKQLRQLTALQDGLGRLNDLATADTLLAQLAREPGASAPMAAYARGYLAAVGAAHRKPLGKVLRRVHEKD